MSAEHFQPGVCVACRATSETTFDPDGMAAPCCMECKEDGSFTTWLEHELSVAIAAAGGTYRIDEHGRKLWTL